MITFEKLLQLANQAASDRSLIPNHLGTVDRRLRSHLRDRMQLLTSLLPHENEPTAAELIPGLRHDIVRIQAALRSYASVDHVVGRANLVADQTHAPPLFA